MGSEMCIRDRTGFGLQNVRKRLDAHFGLQARLDVKDTGEQYSACLLYTSDAADERSSVDLGGRRIIKKKTPNVSTGLYST